MEIETLVDLCYSSVSVTAVLTLKPLIGPLQHTETKHDDDMSVYKIALKPLALKSHAEHPY